MTGFFQPGDDPREYFVGRVREQAAREQLLLTEFEEQYLELSAQGQDQAALDLLDTLGKKESTEFDRCISGLAWRGYEEDLSAYAGAADSYRNAIRALAGAEKCLNLGMFVSCIATESAPDRDISELWLKPLVVAVIVALVLLGFWNHWFSR